MTWRRRLVLYGIAVVFTIQLIIAGRGVLGILYFGNGIDYMVLTEAGRRAAEGLNPYETDVLGVTFRWHPLTAWFFYAVAPLGITVWRLVNLASLALLRDWRLIALTLVSWPLWDALYAANATTICAVVGCWALRSRLGGIAYLGLVALIPRPWMVPLAIWLVWRRPDLRLPAVLIAVAGASSALLAGWGSDWVASLATAGAEMSSAYNYGPTRLFGAGWLAAGVPLGVWLAWKGRVGLAGLAVSPYLFAHYYLALLWEWQAARRWLTSRSLAHARTGSAVSNPGFPE